ncbi:MAG: hypothetical protein EA001_01805 [Oscillatoriales cyanobacterium]|nr:MAG: hypothetical protein EA001_01805 [Oscillatoriales cyanobacterium]
MAWAPTGDGRNRCFAMGFATSYGRVVSNNGFWRFANFGDLQKGLQKDLRSFENLNAISPGSGRLQQSGTGDPSATHRRSVGDHGIFGVVGSVRNRRLLG